MSHLKLTSRTNCQDRPLCSMSANEFTPKLCNQNCLQNLFLSSLSFLSYNFCLETSLVVQ